MQLFIVKRAVVAVVIIPFLISCATYSNKLQGYYKNLDTKNYTQAQVELDNNKFLNKKRNTILFCLEQGKLYHLQNKFDSSNLFLNLADALIEAAHNTLGNAIIGNVINPMMQNYTAENYEIFMVHYYKALNYLQQNNIEDAVVEARRITLSNNALNDKINNKNKYSNDVFSMILKGLIYEVNNDINNAFISYRNAIDIFIENKSRYYGIGLPKQLVLDFTRTATQLGFSEILESYKSKFTIEQVNFAKNNGELIVFFEQGKAPVKTEQNFNLTTSNTGIYLFTDVFGVQQNIDIRYLPSFTKTDFASISNIRIAMPVFEQVTFNKATIIVSLDSVSYFPTLCQNLNELAPSVLHERSLQEITKILIRQVTKKAIEKTAKIAATAIANNATKDKKSDGTDKTEKEKKKDKEDNKLIGDVAGFALNIFNSASEKADTRNWQSLPAYVSYVRIPLKIGSNTINIEIGGIKKAITITSNGSLQIVSINSW
jgi:uncharacterized protein